MPRKWDDSMKLDIEEARWEVGKTAGSCRVEDFSISGAEPSKSATKPVILV
jgi:hypothetical protein